MIFTSIAGFEKQAAGFFANWPEFLLSAVLIGIAAFALYMAFIPDHVYLKAGAVAWLLLP